MQTVTKKPKGSITIKSRHRTTNGMIYRPGDTVEYFSIIEKLEGCGCPGTAMVTNKYYNVNGGLIPTLKATINEDKII